MSTRIHVDMKPISTIINRLGLGKNGAVQGFVTNSVNRRITRYMPYRAGVLATKSKYITSPSTIEVISPYARYQYYGKAMAGPAPKYVTDRSLNYDKTEHPLAGPLWDRRMMAAEGKQIAAEVQRYVDRKAGKRR